MADSTTNLDTIQQSQSQKEVTANALFDAASPMTIYGRRASTCVGLTWGYYGGRWGGASIANGTATLTGSTTNYMVVNRSTGAVSFSTSTTNWNDVANYARAYLIVTGSSGVASYEDHRAGTNGTQTAGAGHEFRGLNFVSDTSSTADSDPGAGIFKWNNATQASATALYFDNATSDGASLATFYASLGGSGYIHIQQVDDPTKWQLWKWGTVPADGTGYRKFTSATLQAASASAIGDDEACFVVFITGGGLTYFAEAGSTSSPHNVTGMSSLTAASSLTNADAVFSPKGTGALLTHVPDSTSAGGDKRGASAVDLQMVRANANQVASGVQSFIGGGANNRATGNTTSIPGGTGNLASDTGATVGGGQANTASAANATVAGGGGSGAGNTASGIASSVTGGQLNTASGNYSTAGGIGNAASGANSAAFGASNTAGGTSSVATGTSANAMGLYGARVHAAGQFGVGGYSQRVEMVLRAETTNGTQTALTADGGAGSATNQLTLPNSSAYLVRGQVVARENATGDCATWEFVAAIKRGANAAATAMIAAATVTAIANDAGAAAWALAVDADTTNGCLRIRFTGEAAKTIRTTCVLRAAQTVL